MKQFRFYEKVAGVCLVGCLAGMGCGPREPEPKPTPGVEPAAPEPALTGAAALLPATAAGLARSDAPRRFGPDNLYELINGGAEVFVDYGLVGMAVADYAGKDRPGVTVTVELYDMGSVAGAFGRAARNLASLEDPGKAGEGLPEALRPHGQLGSGDLWVWQGQHLLHATLLDESDSASAESTATLGAELLPAVAAAVLAKVPPQPSPPELERFPTARLIERSQQRWPKRTLDRELLGPGWSASYRDGEIQWIAFIAESVGSAAKDQELVSQLNVDGAKVEAACGRWIGVVLAGGGSQTDLAERLAELKRSACPAAAP